MCKCAVVEIKSAPDAEGELVISGHHSCIDSCSAPSPRIGVIAYKLGCMVILQHENDKLAIYTLSSTLVSST